MNRRRLVALVLLVLLVVSGPLLAEVVAADVAVQLQSSPLMERPETEITTLSTAAAEILASGDQSYTGFVRASILNQGSVDVCVSWSGAVGTACSAGGSDCDGDDDDGLTLAAGDRYSPIFNASKLGRLCAAAASGTPDVKVEYDTP